MMTCYGKFLVLWRLGWITWLALKWVCLAQRFCMKKKIIFHPKRKSFIWKGQERHFNFFAIWHFFFDLRDFGSRAPFHGWEILSFRPHLFKGSLMYFSFSPPGKIVVLKYFSPTIQTGDKRFFRNIFLFNQKNSCIYDCFEIHPMKILRAKNS